MARSRLYIRTAVSKSGVERLDENSRKLEILIENTGLVESMSKNETCFFNAIYCCPSTTVVTVFNHYFLLIYLENKSKYAKEKEVIKILLFWGRNNGNYLSLSQNKFRYCSDIYWSF